ISPPDVDGVLSTERSVETASEQVLTPPIAMRNPKRVWQGRTSMAKAAQAPAVRSACRSTQRGPQGKTRYQCHDVVPAVKVPGDRRAERVKASQGIDRPEIF
ncbi:hypothetical protein TELCIR_14240, partial [Teladorsagia circumcincta]